MPTNKISTGGEELKASQSTYFAILINGIVEVLVIRNTQMEPNIFAVLFGSQILIQKKKKKRRLNTA